MNTKQKSKYVANKEQIKLRNTAGFEKEYKYKLRGDQTGVSITELAVDFIAFDESTTTPFFIAHA